MNPPYVLIGKIGKTHSLSGLLNIYFDVEVINSSFKTIYVKQKEHYLPYFIDKLEIHGDSGFVQFEDIHNKETAQKLVNCEIYIKQKEFNKYFIELEDELEDLIDYKAYNLKTYIGVVTELLDNSAHLLAEIKNGDKDYIVPLVDEFIVEIDDKKKTIVFNLPEGLLEM